jgi:site-specific DNA recombinase
LARVDENQARGNDPDPALTQAVARAHVWVKLLTDGTHASIDSLAASINMHPKVVRKGIRLAFLAPGITEAIMLGHRPSSLALTILYEASSSLSWAKQRLVVPDATGLGRAQ